MGMIIKKCEYYIFGLYRSEVNYELYLHTFSIDISKTYKHYLSESRYARYLFILLRPSRYTKRSCISYLFVLHNFRNYYALHDFLRMPFIKMPIRFENVSRYLKCYWGICHVLLMWITLIFCKMTIFEKFAV